MLRCCIAHVVAWALAATAEAQQRTTAILRIVDVGNGLCVVAWAPPNHTMVYDAGFIGTRCADTARALSGGDIRLMVLSHSDQDHITDAEQILEENRVRLFIHPATIIPTRRCQLCVRSSRRTPIVKSTSLKLSILPPLERHFGWAGLDRASSPDGAAAMKPRPKTKRRSAMRRSEMR